MLGIGISRQDDVRPLGVVQIGQRQVQVFGADGHAEGGQVAERPVARSQHHRDLFARGTRRVVARDDVENAIAVEVRSLHQGRTGSRFAGDRRGERSVAVALQPEDALSVRAVEQQVELAVSIAVPGENSLTNCLHRFVAQYHGRQRDNDWAVECGIPFAQGNGNASHCTRDGDPLGKNAGQVQPAVAIKIAHRYPADGVSAVVVQRIREADIDRKTFLEGGRQLGRRLAHAEIALRVKYPTTETWPQEIVWSPDSR